MTYLEKYIKEHPGVDPYDVYERECCIYGDCPFIGDESIDCKGCWNREIPEKKLSDVLNETGYVMNVDNPNVKEKPIHRPEYDEPRGQRAKLNLVGDELSPEQIGTEYIVSPQQLKEALALHGEKAIPEPCYVNVQEVANNIVVTETNAMPHELIKAVIKDSGARREFETGAVRDIQEGKGRCDLLPLDVVARFIGQILANISEFQETGDIKYLENALQRFIDKHYNKNMSTTFLEVSKHFEEGAKKYGEYNWQKGIPTHCYIDSAVRHYLKYLRGDKDEPHDRAFVWNILCCIWTCIHKPELNDYKKEG